MKTTDEPVIISETYPVPVQELWTALTDHQRMIQWYFDDIPAFKPVVGFETSFPVYVEDRQFTHCWKVTDVSENRLIKYDWSYAEHNGIASVAFELTPKDDGSHLKLRVEIHEDFPADIPEFDREACVGGWNYFLGERLKEFLGD